jgi:hypothetical protein
MPWNPTTSRATGFKVTAQVWNDEVVENFEFLEEVSYNPFVDAVSVTATTEGTANAIVADSARTYEAVPHLIEFFSISARPAPTAGARLDFGLFDSTTALGLITTLITPAAANMFVPVYAPIRLTPTAASHTYNVKAWVSTGTGTVSAGAGGAGLNMPGYLRITRVAT